MNQTAIGAVRGFEIGSGVAALLGCAGLLLAKNQAIAEASFWTIAVGAGAYVITSLARRFMAATISPSTRIICKGVKISASAVAGCLLTVPLGAGIYKAAAGNPVTGAVLFGVVTIALGTRIPFVCNRCRVEVDRQAKACRACGEVFDR
jgi:hypothetical protein